MSDKLSEEEIREIEEIGTRIAKTITNAIVDVLVERHIVSELQHR